MYQLKFYSVFIICFLTYLHSSSQKERDLLTDNFSRKQVNEAIVKKTSWINYPSYYDRDAWNNLPESLRRGNIEMGEKYLGFQWPVIQATMYLDFTRTGDRSTVDRVLNVRSEALQSLVFAELIEGKGRFIDDIINGVFSYCEQSYWGSSAHFYLYGFDGSIANPTTNFPDINNPIIDLKVGDTAADLAWIWYFFHEKFDEVSPIISKRLKDEIMGKVLNPYYNRYDFWWITGWDEGRVNNWTPWCNHNILTCILLLEDDPVKKGDAIYKTMTSVDLFINSYPDDGGCSEGPSYWGHAGAELYGYLYLLKNASFGKIDIFNNELIKNIGRYIYRFHISEGNKYINFADAPQIINHDPGKIYRFGSSINDEDMKSFGAYLLKNSDYGNRAESGRIEGTLENLFNLNGWQETEAKVPLISDYYFPDLDVAYARDKAGTNEGFYFAAKGGSNGEQHNHNDVGSFVLYYNGSPALIDVGVGTYTRQTFSKDRYKIWTMQSDYHNLPVINGFGQHQGRNFKAKNSKYSKSKNKISFSTEISKAYPDEADVNHWIRSYTLDRNKSFLIRDNFELAEANGETSIHFITGLNCEIIEDGKIKLFGNDFTLLMSFDNKKLNATIEIIEIEDIKLKSSLGDKIARVVFDLKKNQLSDDLWFEIVAIK